MGIERLADFHHLLAGEISAGGELGDRFEVMVLPPRQAPTQHSSRGVADVLEAVRAVSDLGKLLLSVMGITVVDRSLGVIPRR